MLCYVFVDLIITSALLSTNIRISLCVCVRVCVRCLSVCCSSVVWHCCITLHVVCVSVNVSERKRVRERERE